MFRIFSRDRSHLWRCPLTRTFHDPRVLMRQLCEQTPLTLGRVRFLLRLTQEVTPAGTGYSETQVEAAYEAFLRWYEGKGLTGQSSPTPAPSTESPPA